MLARARAVHVAGARVIHRLEMKDDAPVVGKIGRGKRPSVPQKLVWLHLPVHAREWCFRRVGHAYVPVPRLRSIRSPPCVGRFVGCFDRVVPPTVEQLEVLACKLRPGMDRLAFVSRCQCLAPWREELLQLNVLRLVRCARQHALDIQHCYGLLFARATRRTCPGCILPDSTFPRTSFCDA